MRARDCEDSVRTIEAATRRVPLATPGLLDVQSAVALQRAAGNRVVARVVAQRQLAREPVQVENTLREPRVGGAPAIRWTSRYDVEFLPGACVVTLRVNLRPDAGVTAQQTRRVKRDARRAFMRIWDGRFDLEDRDSGEVFPLHFDLQFTSRRPHLNIALHPGNATDDLSNWYVDEIPIVRAHELGHALGMYDEYVDPTVVNRQTAASPGIRTDHSIMGNYRTEGIPQARARLRHGQRFARHIGHATGRRLTARYHERAAPTLGPGDFPTPSTDAVPV